MYLSISPLRSALDILLFDGRYRRLRLVIAFGLYALVVILGSVPGARHEVGRLASGVVLHSLTYGFITTMLFGGLGRIGTRRALLSLGIVIVLGGLDESVQVLFPYRSAAMADWGVDILASLITLVLLLALSLAGWGPRGR